MLPKEFPRKRIQVTITSINRLTFSQIGLSQHLTIKTRCETKTVEIHKFIGPLISPNEHQAPPITFRSQSIAIRCGQWDCI